MPRSPESQHAHEDGQKPHVTLPFLFTPVEQPRADQPNPHAKASGDLPDVVDALKAELGEAFLDDVYYAGETTVYVEKSRIADVLTFLRDAHGFTYLSDLGGLDRFTEDDRYEVMYSVCNIDTLKRLRVKVRVDEDDETLPTVTGVYRAAMWHERELWDMFGLQCEGLPDKRRMLLPDDFEYHPLRKEFPTLGIPGSLPLPAQSPDGPLVHDQFPRAHGLIPEQK